MELINQREDALAERVYNPWIDMERAMREAGIPLYSLESKQPLRNFDILGVTLPYETLYTNLLNALELAGIPLISQDRSANDPLVIAGGHSTYNPEPMHLFLDAFVIGEGEQVIHEIIDTFQTWKRSSASRQELLVNISRLNGVYVPSVYQPFYKADWTIEKVTKMETRQFSPFKKGSSLNCPLPQHILSFPILRLCITGWRLKSCAAARVAAVSVMPGWFHDQSGSAVLTRSSRRLKPHRNRVR
jgi:radical SAM superfamily enzyme YgiQ (UPF0313 family)